VLAVTTLGACAVLAQPVEAAGWGTGTLTPQNLRDLISQMSITEEIGMVHGEGDPPNSAGATADCTASAVGCVGEAGWVPGVKRLGIPPLRLTDGPAGIRLAHVETAMPAPVGLTASFDRSAAQLYGKTVGDAGRATNQDVWLAPMINQVSFITGGRNFETLGEDPFLAGQLVAPEVQGVQGEGMVAMLKHFVENDFENGRTSTSVKIDDQTLHENELQAFESGIHAGAGAVMCSYNRINDVYGCANDHTLLDILKGQLGFSGFVTSDWGATHHTADLLHGLDMEQPGSAAGTSNFSTAGLTAATTSGTAAVPATNDFPAEPAHTAADWKTALDNAVFRILTEMNNIGLLEGTTAGAHHTDGTPYVPPRPDLDSLKPVSFAAAQSIAEDGATLLKNDGKALPLSSDDLSGAGTVVLGPTATAPYTSGGGSSHVTPYDPAQSPYDALLGKAASGSKLSYVPGYDLDGQLVPSSALTAPDPAEGYPNWTLNAGDAAFAGQNGLLRQQITTAAVASGAQPVAQPGGAADRLDPTVDYTGANTLPAGTGWRWSGTLTAPSNPGGTGWQLKVFVANQANSQLFVDGLATAQRRVNIGAYPAAPASSFAGLSETAKSHDPSAEGLQQATYSVTLTAGQKIHLDLRLVTGASAGQIQFKWVPPDDQAASIAAAASAAAAAKKAVIFAYDEGTEGSDRGGSAQGTGIALPGYQDALIAAVAAAQPNTVVVLNTGDPVLMPWAGAVKSILEMWYPGQEGGPATADVLLGNANPSGKLPVTFPADATHFPTYDPNCTDTSATGNCPLYPGVEQPGFLSGLHSFRQITNLDGASGNGIFQGYRWYDKHAVTPLYPFGYGLSYTTFGYSNLTVTPRFDGTVDVGFDVKNTGTVAGADVAQVYVGAGPAIAGVQQAVKALHGFDKVTLNAGETRHETITLAQRSFQYWSVAQNQWVTNYGPRTIWVGDSSAASGLPLSATTAPLTSTSTTAPVSGSVPATLALTLGAPAAFGAFTPGVTADYTASTTANVISTAGDATLSVADPSSTATGHLVNGAFSLPSPLQARARNAANSGTAYNNVGSSASPLNLLTYDGPVSNDAVTLQFSQHIGSTDALRTGTYSKTLTFTLSTTSP
jgi:beta-glucosidase